MSARDPGSVADVNEEAVRAWDGPLFDRFVQFREIVTTGLGVHGEAALGLFPPVAGERVLDDDVRAALREGLAEFEGPAGLRAGASTWIVSASAPEG
jgi:hypothetical protein